MPNIIRTFTPENRELMLIVDKLKEDIWPEADAEHYGNSIPNDLFKKSKVYLIFEEEGEPVGYLSMTIDAGVAHIGTTAVLKKRRRQGIARQLKLKAEEEAKRLGCHKMFTTVGVGWASQYLNESIGYRQVCLLERHSGRLDFYLYDKLLD